MSTKAPIRRIINIPIPTRIPIKLPEKQPEPVKVEVKR